jgi:hypothetical protein
MRLAYHCLNSALGEGAYFPVVYSSGYYCFEASIYPSELFFIEAFFNIFFFPFYIELTLPSLLFSLRLSSALSLGSKLGPSCIYCKSCFNPLS